MSTSRAEAPGVPRRLRRSLRSQILVWLMVLFAALLVFGTAASYVSSIEFADRPYDRQLAQIARALGTEFELHGIGGLEGDANLPESINRLVDADEADEFFYKITGGDGRLVAGDPELPTPAPTELSTEPQFEHVDVRGVTLRIATVTLPVANEPGSRHLVVQVAETLNKRRVLARSVFVRSAVPQIILTVLASFGLWVGLGSGLAPLLRLRETIATRAPQDLSPIEIHHDTPDEVRPVIEAFNEVLERMRRVLAARRQFVADAAHQLRTPLAGVRMQAELALRLEDPAAVRTTLQLVLTGAERGTALIRQLLALARHEEGGEEVALRPLDLNGTVRAATTKFVDNAIARGIDLGFEPWTTQALVTGEPISLEEMVSNLIDNAVRYTPRGGKVTARVVMEGASAVIVVEDDGPGIPAAERERVFDRFYRRLGTDQEGSGLGLAIVQEIARIHDATIRLGGGPHDRGAVFLIRFPAVDHAQ